MTRLPDRFTTASRHCVAACAWTALLWVAQAHACLAAEQKQADLLRYKLTCQLHDDRSSIECTADIWVRILRDSLGSVFFRFPPSAKIHSLTDAADNDVERRMLPHAESGSASPDVSQQLRCTLPEGVGINDSLLFRIRFDASFDTTPSDDVFINEREFLLQSLPGAPWMPMLSGLPHDALRSNAPPVVIDMHVPSGFTVIAGGVIDSLDTKDGITTWRITRTDVRAWEESFCIAGSKRVRVASVQSAHPGACGVTLYTPNAPAFDSLFAGSIVTMLGRASEYFASLHALPRYGHITFAAIGEASVNAEPITSGSLVVVRTAPKHAWFDSSIFVSSAHNEWLLEMARAYAFTVPDSSYWFDESWAGYLATRFLFESADTSSALQMNERSHILSHALDFFPARPLSAGRTGAPGEAAVFTYKGRYVFLMLEYILGRDAFDGVMRTLYRESAQRPPSIARLQMLCEAAYGSTLGWFFDEWLDRTGFPEYGLAVQTDPTPRGNYEVAVTVTQRGELFTMPLNIHIEAASRSFLKRVFVSQARQRFTFMLPSAPTKVEWNPQYLVLRWVQHFRILAHARTSVSFRVYSHDLAASEREARLTLQLDPDNANGANAIALFSLGMAAGARHDWSGAEAYFLDASKQRATDEYAFYPMLSAVRHANILDITGRRTEALAEYHLVLDAAGRDPLVYNRVIIEARRFLREPFVSTDDAWYDQY